MTDRSDPSNLRKRALWEETLRAVDIINGKLDTMADEIGDLRAEVQEDIRDDSARDALIAKLESQIGTLTQTAQDAVDRANLSDAEKAQTQADLDAAKAAVAEQVEILRGSDFPNA